MVEREQLVSMVRALQQGEDGAATVIYETFQSDIYYYILKTVNDPHLAEDLTQDTFMEILETIGKLQEPAAFVTWSRQIAYHRCTGHFRKRRELLADEDADGYSVFDTIEEDRTEFIPDEALDKAELRRTIQKMVDGLPAEQRTAVMMRYFDELSIKDIARIQGVSEGTVKSRLNYGRKVIKQSVEDYEKKNGIKLRCAGVVPLLLWLFREYRLANGISLTASTVGAGTAAAVGTGAAAAAGTGTAVAVGTSAAAKAGSAVAGHLAAKIIAGVAAAAVAIGGTVAVLTRPETPEESAPIETTQIPTTIPTQPPEVKLMHWWGYGTDATKLHTRRFEIHADTMTDTAIRGTLEVTYLYEVSHTTAFEGTGTEVDGKIRYDLVFEEPAVMGTIPTYEYSEMPLLYDPETETLTFEEHYYAVLNRSVADPREEILVSDGVWSGEGENVLCWPNPQGHSYVVQIDEMTCTRIQGSISVYESGTLEHQSAFTGRGFQDGETVLFEAFLESPHYAYDMWDSVEEYFWIRYDPVTDTLRMNSYYEFELERNESAKNSG